MSIAIIDSKKTKSDLPLHPTDAHLRNAYVLKDELNATILYNRNDLKKAWNKNFNHIIISYASFYADIHPYVAWMEDRKELSKFYFLTNEYNLNINWAFEKFLRKNGYDVIANHVESGSSVREYNNYHTVNLNLLLFKGRNKPIKKKYDLIYWGSYRKNREVYFEKYFDKNMMLSTSSKNLKKFRKIGCESVGINKLEWKKNAETLNLFKYTLYIEDQKTHEHYSHLANRFYEALQCNVLMFFDVNAKKTTELAGLDVEEFYFVNNAEELQKKIKIVNKNYNERLNHQARWIESALVERKELMKQLKEIFYV